MEDILDRLPQQGSARLVDWVEDFNPEDRSIETQMVTDLAKHWASDTHISWAAIHEFAAQSAILLLFYLDIIDPTLCQPVLAGLDDVEDVVDKEIQVGPAIFCRVFLIKHRQQVYKFRYEVKYRAERTVFSTGILTGVAQPINPSPDAE